MCSGWMSPVRRTCSASRWTSCARGPRTARPSPGLLGDIVLCPQVAEGQAQAARHELIDELILLTTHGLLHLLGFDHAEPEEEREMFGLQKELIGGFAHAERGR